MVRDVEKRRLRQMDPCGECKRNNGLEGLRRRKVESVDDENTEESQRLRKTKKQPPEANFERTGSGSG
ncbi:unnamed protein product [Bursaphelenchus okinawaensis]|uniref:Uncharacterized protein n=1 Tax=Bursaphelenchus okinawaensis TaxID=465554 RepID=A0A811KW55_9BILA|nr:unnamed protein product [Bursaphelenchus okinawaensis]CAG9112402.1 unnamed protein product [Bursaphelenchus okinawaensis]